MGEKKKREEGNIFFFKEKKIKTMKELNRFLRIYIIYLKGKKTLGEKKHWGKENGTRDKPWGGPRWRETRHVVRHHQQSRLCTYQTRCQQPKN